MISRKELKGKGEPCKDQVKMPHATGIPSLTPANRNMELVALLKD